MASRELPAFNCVTFFPRARMKPPLNRHNTSASFHFGLGKRDLLHLSTRNRFRHFGEGDGSQVGRDRRKGKRKRKIVNKLRKIEDGEEGGLLSVPCSFWKVVVRGKEATNHFRQQRSHDLQHVQRRPNPASVLVKAKKRTEKCPNVF
ncbi:hypothetical protein M378DRAFT_1002256 [Amanita muscaria Koide BX008]|uniref:Uncharacterized protein n=1 Tax=Amanita muscaria (strain Koide BX008) TaxID=946122 RepID=A0A0C2WRZ5_AMAMK|nr:hypothetical protein M378DRAFT_1002256 [Amanita muscaria Koide BX008]